MWSPRSRSSGEEVTAANSAGPPPPCHGAFPDRDPDRVPRPRRLGPDVHLCDAIANESRTNAKGMARSGRQSAGCDRGSRDPLNHHENSQPVRHGPPRHRLPAGTGGPPEGRGFRQPAEALRLTTRGSSARGAPPGVAPPGGLLAGRGFHPRWLRRTAEALPDDPRWYCRTTDVLHRTTRGSSARRPRRSTRRFTRRPGRYRRTTEALQRPRGLHRAAGAVPPDGRGAPPDDLTWGGSAAPLTYSARQPGWFRRMARMRQGRC